MKGVQEEEEEEEKEEEEEEKIGLVRETQTGQNWKEIQEIVPV